MRTFRLIVSISLFSLVQQGLSVNAQTLTTIWSFSLEDGTYPWDKLVQAKDGAFYGLAPEGGKFDNGTLFRLTPTGGLTNLYSFSNDRIYIYRFLVQGRDRYFYGVTPQGGNTKLDPSGCGYGTVFRITSSGRSLTNLYSFAGWPSAERPDAPLVQGKDGDFYGVTMGGGIDARGTVFRINTRGKLTILHSFCANDGSDPWAGLTQGSDGYFYGTTSGGGSGGDGTVFRISANGSFTSLHSFSGPDGSEPLAELVQASDGYFYGTTSGGGSGGDGTVFRISASGSFTNLHSFSRRIDGRYPSAGLVQGNDRCLYGVTLYGGNDDLGTVFKISPSRTLKTIWSFTGGADGANPCSGLVKALDGQLYGTTRGGGRTNLYYGYGGGTIYRINPVRN